MFVLWFFLAVVVEGPAVVHGSIYNAYNYDQTVPQYTPDGRLLQVEYASLASQHSSPLVVVPFFLDKQPAILVATTQRRSGGGGGGSSEPSGRDKYKQTSGGQRRIVEVPAGDASILVGLSGILADNVALLRQVISPTLESHQRDFGLRTTSSSSSSSSSSACQLCQRLAVAVGNACETRSLGGGIRPFGATLMLCAVDDGGGATVFVTHPSGAVSTYSMMRRSDSTTATDDAATAAADMSTLCNSVLVVGGDKPSAMQERVRNELEAAQTASQAIQGDKPNAVVQTAVRAVAKVLLESGGSDKATTREMEDGDVTEESLQSLEMVLLTVPMGAHRFSVQHLKSLLGATRRTRGNGDDNGNGKNES